MIRLGLLRSLMFASLMLAACTGKTDGASEADPFHAHMHYLAGVAKQSDAPRVYFIGDSITAALDTSSLAPGSFRVGLSGDRAMWVADRVETYDFLDNASCVVLALGINDVWARQSVDDTVDRLQRIVEKLPETPLVISGILPVGEGALMDGQPVTNAPVNAINTLMAPWCEARQGCTYVMPPSAMSSDGEVAEGLTHDGVHLTGEGYALWRPALAKGLAEAGCEFSQIR